MSRKAWTPELIIALIVIIGGVALKCFGFDGDIWSAVGLAIGFVFGTGYQTVKIRRLEIQRQLQDTQGKNK